MVYEMAGAMVKVAVAAGICLRGREFLKEIW
jgi:hypothetical protein